MTKDNNITEEDIRDAAIRIERAPDFYEVAQQLSDLVRKLPLEHPTNDRLVELMVEQVQKAERGAFLQGFRMGIKYVCGDSTESTVLS